MTNLFAVLTFLSLSLSTIAQAETDQPLVSIPATNLRIVPINNHAILLNSLVVNEVSKAKLPEIPGITIHLEDLVELQKQFNTTSFSNEGILLTLKEQPFLKDKIISNEKVRFYRGNSSTTQNSVEKIQISFDAISGNELRETWDGQARDVILRDTVLILLEKEADQYLIYRVSQSRSEDVYENRDFLGSNSRADGNHHFIKSEIQERLNR